MGVCVYLFGVSGRRRRAPGVFFGLLPLLWGEVYSGDIKVEETGGFFDIRKCRAEAERPTRVVTLASLLA